MATRKEDCDFAIENLSFPMIVKHPSSYGSIGLTKKSKVTSPAELKERAEAMIAQFGSALIEEFIEGKEYTVLIAEDTDHPEKPVAFEPVEYKFPPGESFKHFDLKWIDFEGMDVAFCEDPALRDEMKEMTRRIFIGLRGRGYGRSDIRVDKNGKPWLLEINANPSIFYPEPEFGSADNVLKFDEEGHRGFLRRIIKTALYYQQKRKKKFRIMKRKNAGFGIFAEVEFKEGDIIIPGETKPQNLVSYSFVKNNWNEKGIDNFKRYCHPFTDEIWGMWSENPEEWKPINHSCDPNSWLTGLDVTARRDIARGEEITMDYATFSNELMESFDCNCGSKNCRGTIKGTDFLQNFMKEYGEHVSDYVRRRTKYV
jgi:D-alanine-D-alanine ligase